MNRIRKHLDFASVVSTVGVFLLLAGGTAIAAKQLGKKTVGAKQLKSNAVTTAKIKKAAVTKVKIKDGAIDATKIADGSVTTGEIADAAVTAAKIVAGGTPFSQRVARLAPTAAVPVTGGAFIYPFGSYTQQPGEDNQIFTALDVRFSASCSPPRTVVALLMLDAPKPETPEAQYLIGYLVIEDKFAGAATNRYDFGTYPSIGGSSALMAGPSVATPHTLTAQVAGGSCSSGSGIEVVGGLADVIGTK